MTSELKDIKDERILMQQIDFYLRNICDQETIGKNSSLEHNKLLSLLFEKYKILQNRLERQVTETDKLIEISSDLSKKIINIQTKKSFADKSIQTDNKSYPLKNGFKTTNSYENPYPNISNKRSHDSEKIDYKKFSKYGIL